MPVTDQMVGFAAGIIFCAWFVGATPEQVGLIRLPSTAFLVMYGIWLAVQFFRKNA